VVRLAQVDLLEYLQCSGIVGFPAAGCYTQLLLYKANVSLDSDTRYLNFNFIEVGNSEPLSLTIATLVAFTILSRATATRTLLFYAQAAFALISRHFGKHEYHPLLSISIKPSPKAGHWQLQPRPLLCGQCIK